MKKRSILWCAPLVLMLASCGPTPEESFANAREAFARNDFHSARVALVSALESKPEDAGMLALLARTHLALGAGDNAMGVIDRLAAVEPKNADLPLMRGEAEVLRGQFQAGLNAMDGTDTVDAQRIRALAYIGLGDVASAERAFAAGEAKGPTNAALLAAYARFELGKGNTEAAEQLANRAIAADKQNVDAQLVAARIAASRNALPRALGYYDAALALHSTNFEGMLGKAAVLGEMGRLKEANAIADSLAKDAPDNIQLTILRAQLAGAAGKWDDARALLEPHSKDIARSPNAQMLYGEALLRLGQPAQAQSWLDPLARRFPTNRKLRVVLAEAQLQGGERSAALATLGPIVVRPDATPEELTLAAKAAAGTTAAGEYARRAKVPAPEWLGGELAKADSALRNQQWQEAEQAYEAILKRSRTPNPMVLNNLAYAKSRLGQSERALGLAMQAAALEPNNASILDTAGWLLVQTGDKARGTAMLEKAAKLDPANKAVARHLSEAARN